MPTIRHKYVSDKPSAGDPSLIRAANWNDEHEITGIRDRVVFLNNGDTLQLGKLNVGNGSVSGVLPIGTLGDWFDTASDVTVPLPTGNTTGKRFIHNGTAWVKVA